MTTLNANSPSTRPPEHAELPPLLVPAASAARLLSIGVSTLWRMHASAKVPSPVRLSGRTLWRVEELKRWAEAGCPDRQTWEAMRQAEAKRRRG